MTLFLSQLFSFSTRARLKTTRAPETVIPLWTLHPSNEKRPCYAPKPHKHLHRVQGGRLAFSYNLSFRDVPDRGNSAQHIKSPKRSSIFLPQRHSYLTMAIKELN